jgi:hypothetical protein
MSAESIPDFILKDADNLRIAVAIAEGWAEARGRLVAGFLDRLRAKLLKALPGWETEVWKQFFAHPYPCFFL